MITESLIVVLISLLIYLYKKAWNINQTWKERGVKHVEPVIFFGNSLPMILRKKTQAQLIEDICNAFPNDSVIGYYEFMNPQLFVKDPDLIQKVLIKDFPHFIDHGFEVNVAKSPRDEQLFFMTGNRWKAFRAKMSPIFTSGKLKDIFETMTSCGKNLIDHIEERKTKEIDIREVMGLFSMDVIGAAVFGIDPATLQNPDCDFRKIGKTLVDPGFFTMMRFVLLFFCPRVASLLGISFTPEKVSNYYTGLIQDNFNYRKEKGLYRNDFTQMLMQLKDQGSVQVHSWDPHDDYLKVSDDVDNTEKYEITDDIILAQAQAFMVGGFEATALLITYTLFEMIQNTEIQEEARDEVLTQVKLNGGLTYEALRKMKYVEGAVKETQRMYPIIPYLFRVCTKEYTLPDGFVIRKGDKVAIPITAIHKDPRYFPDPDTYNPRRFFEPAKPGTYLPFGDGPRVCVATRYALMVIKYGVAAMLMKYKLTLSEKTKVPLEFQSKFFGAVPASKILIKVEDL